MHSAAEAAPEMTAGEMVPVALTAYRRLVAHWGLGNEAAAALADVSERTWARMKRPSWSGRVSRDQLLRFSALIGLYKGLHLYFSDALADRWPTLPNTGPLFQGAAPVAHMTAGGLPAILQVRDSVDALRGGV